MLTLHATAATGTCIGSQLSEQWHGLYLGSLLQVHQNRRCCVAAGPPPPPELWDLAAPPSDLLGSVQVHQLVPAGVPVHQQSNISCNGITSWHMVQEDIAMVWLVAVADR